MRSVPSAAELPPLEPVITRRERLLPAVIPTPMPQPPPVAQPLPTLPPPRLPTTDPQHLLIGTARLDSSGRVHEHTLLVALGWQPGQRIDILAVHDAILIRASPTGLHTIGRRGELALPAAARALAGITTTTVVLAAALTESSLVIHPTHTVTRLLCTYYASLDTDHAT